MILKRLFSQLVFVCVCLGIASPALVAGGSKIHKQKRLGFRVDRSELKERWGIEVAAEVVKNKRDSGSTPPFDVDHLTEDKNLVTGLFKFASYIPNHRPEEFTDKILKSARFHSQIMGMDFRQINDSSTETVMKIDALGYKDNIRLQTELGVYRKGDSLSDQLTYSLNQDKHLGPPEKMVQIRVPNGDSPVESADIVVKLIPEGSHTILVGYGLISLQKDYFGSVSSFFVKKFLPKSIRGMTRDLVDHVRDFMD